MPQKRNLKQLERQQSRKDKDIKEKGGRVEKTIGSLEIPEMKSDELLEQLQKMKAITPTGLALQYNLKVSMAKKLLNQLEDDRVVNLVSRSHNLKIYALTSD
jgi:small subunit ribosomal protein S25e